MLIKLYLNKICFLDIILTHLKLFLDNFFVQYKKMFIKILYKTFVKKRKLNLDARFWIQKILLQKYYIKKIY